MKYQPLRYNRPLTKICKGCGKQIPSYVEICPHCLKKQKNVKEMIFKILGIYILICLIGGTLSNINSEEDNNTEVTQEGVSNEITVEDQADETDDAEETEGTLGQWVVFLSLIGIIVKKATKKTKKIYVNGANEEYIAPSYTTNTTEDNSETVEKNVRTRVVICKACGAPNTLSTDVGECEYCGMPIN